MTPGEVVLTAYVLAAAGLILVAIVYALHVAAIAAEPALPTSLDCLDGKHAGCDSCAGCSCHTAVLA